MKMKPLVSVIIPLYNVERYLHETIPSFMDQTYENIEFILVDDCSPDDSLATAESIVEGDERFRFVQRDANGGLSAARNTGIEHANGEYITFWDSDDTVMPYTLERCMDRIIECDADVGCFSAVRVLASGKQYEMGAGSFAVTDAAGGLSRWFHNEGVITGAVSKVVRRSLIERNGIRFIEGELNEDVMYTAAILGASDKVVFCGEPLYYYWERDGSITKSYKGEDRGIVLVHCDQLKEFVEESFPSIMDDYLLYRAQSVWGSILEPLSKRSGVGTAPRLFKQGLDDLDRYPDAYRRYMQKYPLGSMRIFLVRHGLYKWLVK